jgi:hypothetical protein
LPRRVVEQATVHGQPCCMPGNADLATGQQRALVEGFGDLEAPAYGQVDLMPTRASATARSRDTPWLSPRARRIQNVRYEQGPHSP